MNTKQKHIELLNEQILATMFFIGTLLVSILLTYDEIKEISHEKKLFSNKLATNISLLNRIVVVILGLYFLYNSYTNQKLGELENKNLKYLKLQTTSSLLALIASLIVLYVIIQNVSKSNFNVTQVENPVL